MSQPVKLSDSLILDAPLAGEAQQRSIAGRVEFWAKLGKSVELLLNGEQVMRLQRIWGSLASSRGLKQTGGAFSAALSIVSFVR